mgnify:CR=1 FL=1
MLSSVHKIANENIIHVSNVSKEVTWGSKDTEELEQIFNVSMKVTKCLARHTNIYDR